uniref:Carbonic anhydrase n=1 Tax=Lotharella globosa TaxID=91324 RepID=A0A7S3Z4I3_9EUKA
MPTLPPVTVEVVNGDVMLEPSSNSTKYNYRADKGPDVWHTLAPEWDICMSGTEQSPIDIVTSDVVSGVNTPIMMDYAPAPVSAVNKGSTLLLNFPATNTMAIGDRNFTLIQCHLHTTSEHTVNGASFPIEIHFVHADANSNLAVLGVMVQEGAASPVFPDIDRLNQIFPDQNGVVHETEELIQFEGLFPQDRSYYHYFGSLTTPPCAENVMWHVFREPITMSKEQLSVLLMKLNNLADASELGMSNRPVMPLGERTVYLGQNPEGLRTGNTEPPAAGSPAPEKTAGNLVFNLPKEGPTFNYTDLDWADITPEWDICASGQEQSPINIVHSNSVAGQAPQLTFSYTPTPLNIENNGKSLTLKGFDGNTMEIDGTTYDLVNIHMHHNSEHLFNGGAFPLEIHFVHADADGNLAVIGVMVEEGAANTAIPGDLKTFAQVFPGTKYVDYEFPTISVDMTQWLPADKTFYHYMGSLTTPPCSENVKWHVMQNPITMSRDQMSILLSAFKALDTASEFGAITMSKDQMSILLNAFKSLDTASEFGFTHRPAQPINERVVTIGYPPKDAQDGLPTVSTRVSFPFEYFGSPVGLQQQFSNEFIKQVAMVAGVSESAVRIVNLEKGSTIVTAQVTPAFEDIDSVKAKLEDPEAMFSADNGWDTSTFGTASAASTSNDGGSNDNDDDKLSSDQLALVIILCVLIPVLLIANLIACCCLMKNKEEKSSPSKPTMEDAMKAREMHRAGSEKKDAVMEA